MRKTYPTDLSDAQWNYIEPHLPVPKGHGRPRIHDLREILKRRLLLRPKERLSMALVLPHDFPSQMAHRLPLYFRKWRIE
jgi:transposase